MKCLFSFTIVSATTRKQFCYFDSVIVLVCLCGGMHLLSPKLLTFRQYDNVHINVIQSAATTIRKPSRNLDIVSI